MRLEKEQIIEKVNQMSGDYIVYITDEENGLKTLYVTESVPALLGYTKEEFDSYVIEHTVAEFWGFPEDIILGKLNRQLISGEKQTFTTQLFHKEHGAVWIYSKSHILGELGDETVLLVELVDVSKVVTSVGILTDENSRCIYVIDKEEHKLLYVNKTFEKWSRKKREDLLGGFCYEKCSNCSENTGKPCVHCFPVEALQNGGRLEQQGKDGKTFFALECQLITWGGHPAYAIVISDVTEQKQSDKERLEKHYHRMNMTTTSTNSVYATYSVNLTQNTAEEMNVGESKEGARVSYDNLVSDILNHLATVKDRTRLAEVLERGRLIQNFRDGHLSFKESAYYQVDAGGDIYMRFYVYMSQNPISKDVECLLRLEDISTMYLLNRIAEYVMNNAYEGLAIIDLKRQLFTPLNKKDTELHVLGETVDYETELEKMASKSVIWDEQKMFVYRAGIANLEKQLAARDHYSVMVHHVMTDGRIGFVRYTYSYLNKDKGIVLCASEDITSDLETDDLTGLLNYEGFAVRAAELIRNEDKEYAALYFNIKGFKAINELFGNKTGDEVLREMTRQFQNSSMEIKLLGRIAVTDHFLCILEKDDVDFDEIKRICHVHMHIDEREISVHGRCGITYIQDRNTPIDRVCDQAKLAKQHIQDEYVQPYAVFDEKMRETYLSKTNAVSVACQALDNNEFCVYYQPIYNAKTGKIASAEALVRWIRPGVGMISPGMFIPALEENGYISLVDRFVARNVREFQQKRIKDGKKVVPVSVNLSWIDFYDEAMMDSVMEDINEMNDRVDVLRYEVTETSWAAMNNRSNRVLGEIKSKGVKILLDDFGSGFSSFSTVRDYDFDVLKIDMGFIQKLGRDEKADGIVCAIIDMAHHIHAAVIAEGVETDAQRQFLADNNCDYLQGYYFSKPISEKEFVDLLDCEEEAAR